MSDGFSSLLPPGDFARQQGAADAAARQAQRLADLSRRTPENKLKQDQIEEAANGFESIFLQMLLKEMRKSVDRASFLEGDSSALQMYEDLFDQHLTEALASQKTLGIGDLVRQYLEEHEQDNHQAYSPEIQKLLAARAAEFSHPAAPAPPAREPEPE